MNNSKGQIGVSGENIFPIIKKFLYSDHEIFLRELISNAVDATNKLKTFSSKGEFKGELGNLNIEVKIVDDKLIISDRGIGMTQDEIDKYINQIAVSGAEEFLKKYKDDVAAIIGHFGLGFYSSFMVASKVEINTLSYKEGAKAVRWSCDGSPEYKMSEGDRTERGTDIILHIDEDNKDYLEKSRIESLLKKYCMFLPVPIVFGKQEEWKDGKYVETDKPKIINNTEPAWTKTPTDLKDEDYLEFYHELYPYAEPPLFHIHLNIDYPFNLTGILYFPKIKDNIDLSKHKIQLYCNQVFVTENVEGIVPDYLTILHGVLDSPDIPLNVSRSYLQSDSNVKKISTYITRKVADKLEELYKEDRQEFEEKWDAIELFVKYGMLTDEKFFERAQHFFLFKNVDSKYYTLEEYKDLIKAEQTDKDGKLIVLYSSNKDEQYSFIKAAQSKAYDVLLADGKLDIPLLSHLEQKLQELSFKRVDSETSTKLIDKGEEIAPLSAESQEKLQGIFNTALPKVEKKNFITRVESQGEDAKPVVILRNEFMRRMKDMSPFQQGMSFYGDMPDTYEVLINPDHPIIKKIESSWTTEEQKALDEILAEIKGFEARKSVLDQKISEKDLTEEEKKTAQENLEQSRKELDSLEARKTKLYSAFSGNHPVISQLLDLAMLSYGLLTGESLDRFVSRSLELLKHDKE